jgi:two-component sensor histidine kinase
VESLINALQHGKEAARIELGWSENEREFRFWVCDNGGGVPSEKSTPVSTLSSVASSKCPESLGLSIVQRLMELRGLRYEPVAQGPLFFHVAGRKTRRSPVAEMQREYSTFCRQKCTDQNPPLRCTTS